MLLCVLKPSTKRCMRNFHVEVVQVGKGNVPKTHSERAKLLFCFFDVLRCRLSHPFSGAPCKYFI